MEGPKGGGVSVEGPKGGGCLWRALRGCQCGGP